MDRYQAQCMLKVAKVIESINSIKHILATHNLICNYELIFGKSKELDTYFQQKKRKIIKQYLRTTYLQTRKLND